MIDPKLRETLTNEVLPNLGKRPRTVLEVLLRDGEKFQRTHWGNWETTSLPERPKI